MMRCCIIPCIIATLFATAHGQEEFEAPQQTMDNHGEQLLLARQAIDHLLDRVEALEAQGPAPELAKHYVTPADAPTPGHPDDGLDDTAALKWCFEFDGHHKPVYLFPGKYQLAKTMHTWRKDGVTIIGAGTLMETKGHPNHYGVATIIEWHGEAGDQDDPAIMWKFGGAGLHCTGVVFDGRDTADLGFMSYNPERALNGVKGQIGFWAMANMRDCGWQFGAHGTDLGSDNFSADYLHAENCEWMYRIASEQAMDHHISHFLSKTANVFDIAAGGRISISSGVVPNAAEIIFRVGAGETGSIGSNNGTISVRNLWLDARAVNSTLLKQVKNVGPRYLFDSIHVAGGTSPQGAIEIQPWASLTIRNAVNLVRPGLIKLVGASRRDAGVDVFVDRSLLLDGEMSAEELLLNPDDGSVWRVRMRDNFVWNMLEQVDDSEDSKGLQ